MKLYLSGPITGIKNYKAAFEAAQQIVENMGHTCVNPATMDAIKQILMSVRDEKKEWELCMRVCIRALALCDGIVMFGNWEDSRGARFELLSATMFGLKRFMLNGEKELVSIENNCHTQKVRD